MEPLSVDLDAYNQVFELFVHAHNLGEAMWSRIELWTGISFGTIALAYIAPNRLTPATTALILLLYFGFSLSVILNIITDSARTADFIRDALVLAEQHDINTEAVSGAMEAFASGPSTFELAAFLFIPGLLIGTIGYVAWTSHSNHRRKPDDA